MLVEIDFQYSTRLDTLGDDLKRAIAEKLTQLGQQLYEKVEENVSGRILQKQTGALASKIRQETDLASNPMEANVYVADAGGKEWALERGGLKNYTIVPTKAKLLHFFAKDGSEVFTRLVDHPPSKEFAYLGRALEEMRSIVPAALLEAIEQVLAEASA